MNDQHTTEDEAAVASFHDDPLEVVRVIAGLAAQYAAMTDDERRGQPSPVRPDSPMALAAKRICLLNGYADDGNELPGFMERAALRELEANPTKEMRALDEAMRPSDTAHAGPSFPWIPKENPQPFKQSWVQGIDGNGKGGPLYPLFPEREAARALDEAALPAEPDTLPPQQVRDLAARCGIKGTDAALVEFAGLVREAQPLPPEEMRPASVAVPDDAPQAAPAQLAIPDVLFDGHAVYQEVLSDSPNPPRTSPQNVAEVLDAVVRLMRRAAPLHPPQPNDGQLRDAIAEGLRGLYGCGRVWSAWGAGTMTEDDFYPADESEECIAQVLDAIRALKGAAS